MYFHAYQKITKHDVQGQPRALIADQNELHIYKYKCSIICTVCKYYYHIKYYISKNKYVSPMNDIQYLPHISNLEVQNESLLFDSFLLVWAEYLMPYYTSYSGCPGEKTNWKAWHIWHSMRWEAHANQYAYGPMSVINVIWHSWR